MPILFLSNTTTLPVSEDPDVPETGRLVSIYDGFGNLDVQFLYNDELQPGVMTPQQISLLNYNKPVDGIDITQVDDYILKIHGTAQNVIQGGTYKFLMPDNSIKFLPANTTEEYDALIGWSPPPIKMQQVTHIIQIRIAGNDPLYGRNETLMFNQEIYWKYSLGLQSFQNALSKGKL